MVKTFVINMVSCLFSAFCFGFGCFVEDLDLQELQREIKEIFVCAEVLYRTGTLK